MIKKIRSGPLSRYGTVVIGIIFFIIFSIASPNFMNMQNISVFMVGRVAVGFFALAALVPLVAGEFDISLGYMLGACIMVAGKVGSYGAPPVVVLLMAFLTGIVLGSFNGLITVVFKIPAVISTLGSGMIFYGISLFVNNSKSIAGVLSRDITAVFKAKYFGFNLSVWVMIITGIVLWYILEHTPFGKNMYVVGMSERVAYLAAIKTKFVRFMSFVIAGAIIGIGAIVILGQSGNAYPDTGPTYLMPGLATVFLSITTHKVGRYNVPGTMVSIILLGMVFNGIGILGAPFWFEGVANGIILLGVVLFNSSDARQSVTG
ncbi:MAG: ABC transporter permease [Suipraeoptans sp.]